MIHRRAATSVALLTLACHHATATPSPTPTSQSRVVVRRGVAVSDAFFPIRGDSALHAFVPDVRADESGGECSLTRTGGSGATTVIAFYPTKAKPRMQVSVTFDSSGRLVRYGEMRGVPRFETKGVRPAQFDSLMKAAEASIRSTSISLDYAIDRAIVMNRGGGKPTNAVLGTVRAVEREDKFGPPTAHLEHMRKLCGV